MVRSRLFSRVLVVFLFLTSMVAEATQLPTPEQMFALLSADAKGMTDTILWLEATYPLAAPLLTTAGSLPLMLEEPGPAAADGKTTVVLHFSKWPKLFVATTAALPAQWPATNAVVQAQFLQVFDTFIHSMAASYSLAEAIKRQYLFLPWGNGSMTAEQRATLSEQLTNLHIWSERAYRDMFYLRTTPVYARLYSPSAFSSLNPWEARNAKTFYYHVSPEIYRTQVLTRAADVAYYMGPVLEAEALKRSLGLQVMPVIPVVVTPAQPGISVTPVTPATPTAPVTPAAPAAQPALSPEARKKLQKEWDDLQSQLAKPENQNNVQMRDKLWELQKQLGKDGDTAAAAPTTAPAQVPVQTDLQKWQAMLQNADVQKNTQLKQLIEDYIKREQAKGNGAGTTQAPGATGPTPPAAATPPQQQPATTSQPPKPPAPAASTSRNEG